MLAGETRSPARMETGEGPRATVCLTSFARFGGAF